jgi:hypothetical protein
MLSPPNVPPLSSGRIRKRRGIRWQRASPWYSTTGEREAMGSTTRRGRLLQRLVGGRSSRVNVSAAHSFGVPRKICSWILFSNREEAVEEW